MKDMADSLSVTMVPLTVVDLVWPDAKPFLEKALKTTKGRYDIKSLYDSLLTGDLALWLVLDGPAPIAAITTRIIEYPTGSRGLAMDWIGGTRMSEWLGKMNEMMIKYAGEYGCTHLEGYGRSAWGRVLERYGWKPEYTAYRMDLKNE